MAARKGTLFEQYFAPVARLLIDQDEIHRFLDSIDWTTECDRLRNPNLVYPAYYSQNFHGIEGGYLTKGAAVTYDPITQYALAPNETWVRQSLIDSIQVKPARILDLGCGTGSTTLLLKQAFPDAEVIGLDLSPFMLVVAEQKAHRANLKIHWQHGKAEQTGFPNASFDLVSASLLFHELPPQISEAVLKESFRLLKPGGEVAILDGSQKMLRRTEWLSQIFEEPYIQSYAQESIEAWMGMAGFKLIQSEEFWWLHQVTRGIKPLPDQEPEVANSHFPEEWAVGMV